MAEETTNPQELEQDAENASNETVEIPREEWKQVMSQMKEMRESINAMSREGHRPKVMRENNEKNVKIRFVDDKPVIGFANKGTKERPTYVYSEQDPTDARNRLLYVDIILLGEEDKPIKVNYNEFLDNTPQVQCRVVDTKVVKDTKEQGMTPKTRYEDYKQVPEGYDVPVEVNYEFRTYTVELPDGKQIKLPEENVNL